MEGSEVETQQITLLQITLKEQFTMLKNLVCYLYDARFSCSFNQSDLDNVLTIFQNPLITC